MQPLITFQNQIGYQFQLQELLVQALTHKSYAFERGVGQDVTQYNERLELLGDAVLDLAVTTLLMKNNPHCTEGELSKLRASLVSEKALSQISRRLKVCDYVFLGRGELLTQGAEKESILASTYEAVIGAIFTDGGFEKAEALVHRDFADLTVGFVVETDYKSELQEFWQARKKQAPSYKLDRAEGLDHQKIFYVSVYIGDEKLAEGTGKSRKEAEQKAAEMAVLGSKNEQ